MSEANMKKPVTNLLLAGALLLPLVGLGYSWATTHRDAQKGTDWDIPVRGYDPRDLLRGHYIQYEYDWPGIGEEDRLDSFDALCIQGTAPTIKTVSRIREREEAGANCNSVVRVDLWSEEYDYSMIRDRLFIPQTKGKELDDKLRDPKLQGVISARIRDDGRLTPQSISFRTNPNPEGVQRQLTNPRELEVIDIEELPPPPPSRAPAQ